MHSVSAGVVDFRRVPMRSETAPAIRLEDYAPPAYRIETVHLDVSLDPDATRRNDHLVDLQIK